MPPAALLRGGARARRTTGRLVTGFSALHFFAGSSSFAHPSACPRVTDGLLAHPSFVRDGSQIAGRRRFCARRENLCRALFCSNAFPRRVDVSSARWVRPRRLRVVSLTSADARALGDEPSGRGRLGHLTPSRRAGGPA